MQGEPVIVQQGLNGVDAKEQRPWLAAVAAQGLVRVWVGKPPELRAAQLDGVLDRGGRPHETIIPAALWERK